MQEQSLVKADPFVLMDRMDDDQILTELKGAVADKLVYSYPQDGKTVEGLSKVGVDAAVKEMARSGEVLRELDCEVYRDTDAYEFIVTVGRYAVTNEREVLLDTAKGFKRQAKLTVYGKPNPFFFEQGGIKAARNAKRRLISEDLVQKILLMARQQGKVQKVAEDFSGQGQAQTAVTAEGGKYYCSQHPAEKVSHHKNDKGEWWSHKLPDGKYCNAGPVKQQEVPSESVFDAEFTELESSVEPEPVKPATPQGLTKAQLSNEYGKVMREALKLHIAVSAINLGALTAEQIAKAIEGLEYQIGLSEKVAS